MKISLHTALLLSLFAVSLPAQATVYDLTNDWSNALNPNGTWSYRRSGVLLTSTTRVGDTWGTPQPSWGALEGWFKSNGTESFPHDWLAGDIITHSPGGGIDFTDIVWTSPVATTISIAGAAWATRDIGRFNQWALFRNGASLTSGTIGHLDPYSRATPMDFALGSGGALALNNLTMAPGDTIQLRIRSTGGVGDYAGARMTITTASVSSSAPEPGTLVLLALGTSALITRRRRSEPNA